MIPPEQPPDPLVGRTLAGTYEVLRPIGAGGMGAIYEVRHVRMKTTFALKRVMADARSHPETMARFGREIEILKRLKHPGIVLILDQLELDDGTPCMVMPFLEGEDLGARIRRTGPQPWELIAAVAETILDALWVAHQSNIIHRDIKPQNIFLERDSAGRFHPKLLDFGISKIASSEFTLNTGDRSIGTPPYMAPELWLSGNVGPQTDVWAMGAVLFEMATGHVAFAGEGIPRIGFRVCYESPEPWGGLRPDAPPAFCEAIDRAITRDPARRIQTIEELRRQVLESIRGRATVPAFAVPAGAGVPVPISGDSTERVQSGASETIPITTLSLLTGEARSHAPRNDDRGPRRARWAAGLAGVAAVAVLLVAGILGGWRWKHDERAAATAPVWDAAALAAPLDMGTPVVIKPPVTSPAVPAAPPERALEAPATPAAAVAPPAPAADPSPKRGTSKKTRKPKPSPGNILDNAPDYN